MSKTLESLTKFVDGYSSITVSAKQIASVNREVDARIAELTTEVTRYKAAKSEETTFIMDGVTVRIHGDLESLERVMRRIHETSDRLGNFIHAKQSGVKDGCES